MMQPALTYDQRSAVADSQRASQARTPRYYGGGEVISLGVPEQDWRFVVQRRLQRLLNLPAGWDGYKATKVSPTVAAFAWNVLESVMKPGISAPSVVPTAGGGLQLEWHENGIDIELYIAKPMKAELYVAFDDGRDIIEHEMDADYSELSEALALL